MNNKLTCKLIAAALLTLAILNAQLMTANAQGTAFTYQGRLNNGAGPANGSYDLTFTLFSTSQLGVAVAGPVTISATVVSNGLFTTTVDFGAGVFTGISSNWLEIAVRTNGSGSFNALTPRQRLTPAPYALYAETANAAGLSGIIPTGDFSGTYGSPVILNNTNNSFTGFAGGLTGVNASLLGGLAPANFWQTSGNAGTSPGVNFFGTTDGADLVFKAHGIEGLRLTPSQDLILQRPSQFADFSERNGLGVYGFTSALDTGLRVFANQNVLGPVLYGEAGGGLGAVSASNQQTLALQWSAFGISLNEPTTINGATTINGNVGINTTSPGSELTLVQANAGGRGAELSLVNNATTTVGNEVAINFGTDPSTYSGDLGNAQIKARSMNIDNRTDIILSTYNGQSFGERMRIQSGGNVGINTSSPKQALEVNGEFMVVDGLGSEQAYLGGDGIGADVQIGSLNSNVTSVAAWNATTAAYMNFRCSSLTIEGGADLAEPFLMSQEQIQPGSVVVIDNQQPGKLKLATQPYDQCVAGIVSGANGIHSGVSMQQTGVNDGGQNVALNGRVYVLADAINGPIQPGDLLTTSGTPGHAMKATDHARAQGAIIGKSMGSLERGTGMVLVLVSLQ